MVDTVAAMNLIVCMGIIWTSIRRLRTDFCRLNLLPRFKYTLFLTGSFIAGLPNVVFGEQPSKSTLILSTSILVYLFADILIWRNRK